MKSGTRQHDAVQVGDGYATPKSISQFLHQPAGHGTMQEQVRALPRASHGYHVRLFIQREAHVTDNRCIENLASQVKIPAAPFRQDAVPNVELALKECRVHGFHLIARPVPAVAFDKRKIAWVYNNVYGLFELVEVSKQIV